MKPANQNLFTICRIEFAVNCANDLILNATALVLIKLITRVYKRKFKIIFIYWCASAILIINHSHSRSQYETRGSNCLLVFECIKINESFREHARKIALIRSLFQPKIQQYRSVAGLHPDPLTELTAISQTPIAGLRGPTSKERGEEEWLSRLASNAVGLTGNHVKWHRVCHHSSMSHSGLDLDFGHNFIVVIKHRRLLCIVAALTGWNEKLADLFFYFPAFKLC